MPRGLLGVGSGDLHLVNGRWMLFLGGYSTSLRNRLYAATAPGSTSPADAEWTMVVDRRGRARPLLPDPPRSRWDGGGMHTPCYVPRTASSPPRLYYAGRAGRRHLGAGSEYAIGVLEQHDQHWHRHAGPVLRGSAPRTSVLEPLVIYDNGRFVMWYLATPHEVAPGEQPDYQLQTTTSADGIDGWSSPEVFSTAAEGFFDNAIARTPSGWSMVLARGTNLHRTDPFPGQGLWLSTAVTADPHRAGWTAPRRILDTARAGTPAWMGGGVCDPALVVSPAGDFTVFVTGTRRFTSRREVVWLRLRRGHLPPVPAPFYLATGSVTFRPDEDN